MPTVMIILNVVFITCIVAAIVGLCAWGIVSDRPFATYLTNRARARHGRENRRAPREAYRRHPAVDAGA